MHGVAGLTVGATVAGVAASPAVTDGNESL